MKEALPMLSDVKIALARSAPAMARDALGLLALVAATVALLSLPLA